MKPGMKGADNGESRKAPQILETAGWTSGFMSIRPRKLAYKSSRKRSWRVLPPRERPVLSAYCMESHLSLLSEEIYLNQCAGYNGDQKGQHFPSGFAQREINDEQQSHCEDADVKL